VVQPKLAQHKPIKASFLKVESMVLNPK